MAKQEFDPNPRVEDGHLLHPAGALPADHASRVTGELVRHDRVGTNQYLFILKIVLECTCSLPPRGRPWRLEIDMQALATGGQQDVRIALPRSGHALYDAACIDAVQRFPQAVDYAVNTLLENWQNKIATSVPKPS